MVYRSIVTTAVLLFAVHGAGQEDGQAPLPKTELTDIARGTWGEAVKLPCEEINTPTIEWRPVVSADGLTLIFGSYWRPDTLGHYDLYMATRATKEEAFCNVRHLVEVSSPAADSGGCISPNGLELYFHSLRHQDDRGVISRGLTDLYLATRSSRDEPFGNVRNLTELNTSGWDSYPWISPDGLYLAVANRPF